MKYDDISPVETYLALEKLVQKVNKQTNQKIKICCQFGEKSFKHLVIGVNRWHQTCNICVKTLKHATFDKFKQ